jgi:HSP20 family protein
MWGYLTGFDDDLFEEFEGMRRRMDQLFGAWPSSTGIRSVAAGTFPAINVGASPEQVDVYVFAAGVDPKSLDISLQQNLLSIAGERKVELPENVQVYRNERVSGGFQRALTLPEDVDPDKVGATYRDGVLHLTLRRREAVRPRQIEVK